MINNFIHLVHMWKFVFKYFSLAILTLTWKFYEQQMLFDAIKNRYYNNSPKSYLYSVFLNQEHCNYYKMCIGVC